MKRLFIYFCVPRAIYKSVDKLEEQHEATKVFNDAVAKTMEELARVAPKDAVGRHDLHQFFLSTLWLNLGQLLFALDRTDIVDTALQSFRHVTTGSRNF